MSRRRWIADRVAGSHAWLTGSNAEHLARVLRAKPGQQFDVAAEGEVRIGTVISISPDEVKFELGESIQVPSLPSISVLLSIFKFDRLEWAIEKLTELGTTRIFPVIARRTEAHLAQAAEKRVQRWRKLALEAAQQSRRANPPEVTAPAPLHKTITELSGRRIVLWEGEHEVSLKSALAGCTPPIALAFGPEGGWTADEIQLFEQQSWKTASLGSNILRAETAAIAAVAVAVGELTAVSS
jgi:16S rRNA (uracil1498-N3)-methyltransferase